jgi:uncharacterized membrane protein YeaQ/YmgE (transglycosylase-associated protein family)
MRLTSALAFAQISTWNLRMHSVWVWVLVGLAAGWLAGMAFRGRGNGCITDIILGVAGSVTGGWLFMNFGSWAAISFILWRPPQRGRLWWSAPPICCRETKGVKQGPGRSVDVIRFCCAFRS